MRFLFHSLLGGVMVVAVTSAAFARAAAPAASPASAPVTAASKAVPTRNAAVMAAENAKEPGVQRPEERVIPQLSVPLKSRNSGATAPAPVGSAPGAVNDVAARCMAASDAADKAACQRQPAASEPVKSKR